MQKLVFQFRKLTWAATCRMNSRGGRPAVGGLGRLSQALRWDARATAVRRSGNREMWLNSGCLRTIEGKTDSWDKRASVLHVLILSKKWSFLTVSYIS